MVRMTDPDVLYRQKMMLWAWMISNGFLAIMLGVSVFAQCTPTRALWDHSVAIQSCPISLTNVAYVTCSWSAAMDFFLAIFPWFVLWDLNMKRREKITVCVSLSLGIFAGVCGVIRTTGLGVLANSADYLCKTRKIQYPLSFSTHLLLSNKTTDMKIS